ISNRMTVSMVVYLSVKRERRADISCTLSPATRTSLRAPACPRTSVILASATSSARASSFTTARFAAPPSAGLLTASLSASPSSPRAAQPPLFPADRQHRGAGQVHVVHRAFRAGHTTVHTQSPPLELPQQLHIFKLHQRQPLIRSRRRAGDLGLVEIPKVLLN